VSSKVIPFPSRSQPGLDRPAAPQAPTEGPSSVTFAHPFMLPGMDKPHSAGTFEVRTTWHELDVPWAAFRKSSRLMLPNGLALEALDVTTDDLEAALARDRMSDPGAE
jgi:hypothetical protein